MDTLYVKKSWTKGTVQLFFRSVDHEGGYARIGGGFLSIHIGHIDHNGMNCTGPDVATLRETPQETVQRKRRKRRTRYRCNAFGCENNKFLDFA